MNTPSVSQQVAWMAMQLLLAYTDAKIIPLRDEHNGRADGHFPWMCCELIEHQLTFDGYKASRWIGYIQCHFIKRGLGSIDEMKDLTRKSQVITSQQVPSPALVKQSIWLRDDKYKFVSAPPYRYWLVKTPFGDIADTVCQLLRTSEDQHRSGVEVVEIHPEKRDSNWMELKFAADKTAQMNQTGGE